MKESPLVTIGLTCFNLEKTIERALKSAINQDWENKEIILIDDCSTDNSKVVLLKLKSLYPQVQIINNIKNYFDNIFATYIISISFLFFLILL